MLHIKDILAGKSRKIKKENSPDNGPASKELRKIIKKHPNPQKQS